MKERNYIYGNLNFIDLSEIDLNKSSDNQTDYIKNNTNLAVLKNVMTSLRDNLLIPYRESRLTNYLANFLTKDSRNIMLLNLSQSTFSY